MCLDVFGYSFCKNEKEDWMLLNDWIELCFFFLRAQIRYLSQGFHDLHGIGPCHIHLLLSFSKKNRLKRGRACWRAACAKGTLPRTRQTQESNWAEIKPLEMIEIKTINLCVSFFFDKPLQYPYQSSNIMEICRGFEHWEVKIETSDVRGVG